MKFRRLLLFTVVSFMICFTLRAEVISKTDLFDSDSFQSTIFGMLLPNDDFILWTPESKSYFALKAQGKPKSIKKLTTHTFNAAALSTGDHNQKLALGSLDGSILVRNVSEVFEKKKGLIGANFLQLPQEKPVTAVAFSPDEQTLAAGTVDGNIAVWDTESGKLLFMLTDMRKNAVKTVSFSPDGIYLATGAMNGSVILWNLWNGPEQRKGFPLNGHNGSVNTIAFSPNSQILATGADDKLINLWKISEKSEPTVLEGHAEAVKVISFSPDGKHLASGGSFGEVLLWDITKTNNTKIDPTTRYKEVKKKVKKVNVTNVDRAHQKDIVAITFSQYGNELTSVCEEKYVKWFLSEIEINPEPTDLFFAPRPSSSLIDHLRKQDKVGPIITIAEEVKKDVPTTITETNITGKIEDLNEVRLITVKNDALQSEIDNVSFDKMNNAFTASVPLQEGNNKITVLATDVKGNQSEPYSLIIYREKAPDTVGPTIDIIEPTIVDNQPLITSNINSIIRGKVTDDSGISAVKVKVNDTIVHDFKETEIKDGEFTATVSLQDGSNEITIIAIDSHNYENKRKVTINRLPQRPLVQPDDTNLVTTEPIKKQTNEKYKIEIEFPIGDEDNIIRAADNPIFVLFKVSPSNNISVKVNIRYADRNLDFPCRDLEHLGGELFRVRIDLVKDQGTMKINVESGGQTVATEQYTIIDQSPTPTPNTQTEESKPIPVEPPPTDRLKPIKIISLRIQNIKLDKSKSYSNGISETEPDGIEVHFSDRGDTPKIAVITSSISGQIDILGKTEGPSGGTIKYSVNNDNIIDVKEYGTEEHEFQLTKQQNQQVLLDYGDNTLTFYAVPPGGTQTVHKQELIINRVHEREGKDYALLIAVDDYENSEWYSLDAPIADAEALKEILESEYGFEIYPDGEVVKNPTKREIDELLTDLIKIKFPNKDDQLLIYMAGHGYAMTLNDDKVEGYFLPKPSEKGLPRPKIEDEDFGHKDFDLRERSIGHIKLRDRIDSIQCDNILVIMDTCYSGVFSGEVRKKKGNQRRLADDKIREKLTKKTRQYLTSGGIETVDDRQDREKHSPFALQLLKALKEGDEDKDSIVTFNELQGYFLPNEFYKATKAAQTPRAGTFSDKHEPGSEFLLWKRKP